MMQYDFSGESPMINDLGMEENVDSYLMYQQHKYCVFYLSVES